MRADNKNKPTGTPWTQDSVREFITAIRPELNAAGFDLALTGSMLYQKEEAGDLDIVIYPMNGSTFNREKLYLVLDSHSEQEFSPGQLKRIWEKRHPKPIDSKTAEKRKLPDGRLFDVFHLT